MEKKPPQFLLRSNHRPKKRVIEASRYEVKRDGALVFYQGEVNGKPLLTVAAGAWLNIETIPETK